MCTSRRAWGTSDCWNLNAPRKQSGRGKTPSNVRVPSSWTHSRLWGLQSDRLKGGREAAPTLFCTNRPCALHWFPREFCRAMPAHLEQASADASYLVSVEIAQAAGDGAAFRKGSARCRSKLSFFPLLSSAD